MELASEVASLRAARDITANALSRQHSDVVSVASAASGYDVTASAGGISRQQSGSTVSPRPSRQQSVSSVSPSRQQSGIAAKEAAAGVGSTGLKRAAGGSGRLARVRLFLMIFVV